MDFVIKEYGNKTAKELISYTHRINSPWHNTAKTYNVLDLLEKELINNTEYLIDMSQLVEYDEWKKEIYLEYIETF
jgi:uncharacterized phage-associated protein